MTLPYVLVDAFAPRPMGGNPAVVVPLEKLNEPIDLDDQTMLDIARELNQPMVAFVGPPNAQGVRAIRWIHPDGESDFCGHATFATGHVLFNELGVDADCLEFDTRAGRLVIEGADKGRLSLTVPAIDVTPIDEPRLAPAIGAEPSFLAKGDLDILMLVGSQAQVENLNPDWSRLATIDARGIVVTAPGERDDVDFVSRFIATTPAGYEDAATGSGHAMLTPFWSERLSKRENLHTLQLSKRGGEFWCDQVSENQVRLTSRGFTFAKGSIALARTLAPTP